MVGVLTSSSVFYAYAVIVQFNSDRCYKGEFEDISGPNLKLLLSSSQQ